MFITPPRSKRPADTAYITPPIKKARHLTFDENGSPTINKVEQTTAEIFPLLPDIKAYTPTKEARSPSSSLPAPEAPRKIPKPNKKIPLTAEQVARADQYTESERVWEQIRTNPENTFLEKGEFRSVYDNGHGIVFKIPNRKQAARSQYNLLCFHHVDISKQNYQSLKRVEAAGLFPDSFRIAQSLFDCRHAVIAQEKCNHMLNGEDLQNPIVRETLKELLRLGHEGFHNMDMLVQNFAFDGSQLIYLDPREQTDDSAGSFSTHIEKFLKNYAKYDPNLYYELDPRYIPVPPQSRPKGPH